MDIKKEINKLEKEISIIEKKTNGIFKFILYIFNTDLFLLIKLLSLFLFVMSTAVLLIVSLVFFVKNVNADLKLFDLFSLLFILFSIPSSHLLNLLFYKVKSKSKNLSKLQKKIVKNKNFFFKFDIDGKKLNFKKLFLILISLKNIKKEEIILSYHNDLLAFLNQSFTESEKANIINFLSEILIDCLVNNKITNNDFNNKLSKYYSTLNYNNKKAIYNILLKKDETLKKSNFKDIDNILDQQLILNNNMTNKANIKF